MYEYTKIMLVELSDKWLLGGAGTPVANCLLSVDPDSEKLVKKDAVFFHHNVAKLFLSKRVRPDIHSRVPLLCKCP